MDEYNEITIPLTATLDISLFKNVVNQGIDSRLEGFTKSTFTIKLGRLYCNIHQDEFSILLRRLTEIADNGDMSKADAAEQWINDILYVFFGIEE